MSSPAPTRTEIATLGGGCFWCLEAVFDELEGVLSVESGYTGGHVDAPTYRAVCGGDTGHAEVVRVEFDPARIGYRQLLDVFFTIHDPTTLNRQGNDVGTQYRSAIYFHSEEQRAIAMEAMRDAQREHRDPLVTELTAAPKYWPAEDYHQEYFRMHGHEPYCQFVVAPKVRKFREKFAGLRKRANA